MCDLCPPYTDDRPTRRELEAEMSSELWGRTICDDCGEHMPNCMCPPEDDV